MNNKKYVVTEQDLRNIFRKGANIDPGESMVNLENAVMDFWLPHLTPSEQWQTKPNWYDAPEWAQWLAQDENGGWGWYEFKPQKTHTGFMGIKGRYTYATPGPNYSWEDTLESRML